MSRAEKSGAIWTKANLRGKHDRPFSAASLPRLTAYVDSPMRVLPAGEPRLRRADLAATDERPVRWSVAGDP